MEKVFNYNRSDTLKKLCHGLRRAGLNLQKNGGFWNADRHDGRETGENDT